MGSRKRVGSSPTKRVTIEPRGKRRKKAEETVKPVIQLSKEERKQKIKEIVEGLGPKKGHPLEDEEILTKLWSLYPPRFEVLKTIRLVCKKWHDASLSRWRSSSVVNLIPEGRVFTTPNIRGIRPTELLSRMSDPADVYRLNQVPFKKYQFFGFQLDMKSDGPSKQFWNEIGPTITYLHLNTCEFYHTVEAPFEFLVTEKLPSLQELRLTETGLLKFPKLEHSQNGSVKKSKKSSATKLSIGGNIPCKLPELIALFPDVKELTLRNGRNAKYTTSLLNTLRDLRRDSNFLKYNLEKLDVKGSYVISNPIMNPLVPSIDERWKLLRCDFKTLSLELAPIERANSILAPLMLANPKVERLELCIIPRYPVGISQISDQFCFPAPMVHLTHLMLWGNTIHSFEFLKFMPNLKSFYCNPLCFQRWTGRGKHHQPCTKDLVKKTRARGAPILLRNMEELWIEHELTPICLKKLTSWMPNLKRLKTVLNRTTFQIVCAQWPGLVHLGFLFGSELDDKMLLGETPSPRRGRARKTDIPVGNLSCFSQLNVFTYDEYCDTSKLTDNCVPVFTNLKYLTHLRICVTDRLSPQGEAILKEKIGWCEITRNGGDGPHGNCNCCLRKRFATKGVSSGDTEEDDETEDEALLSDEETDDSDEEEGADDFFTDESEDDDDDDIQNPLRGYIPVLVAMQRFVQNNIRRRANQGRLRN